MQNSINPKLHPRNSLIRHLLAETHRNDGQWLLHRAGRDLILLTTKDCGDSWCCCLFGSVPSKYRLNVQYGGMRSVTCLISRCTFDSLLLKGQFDHEWKAWELSLAITDESDSVVKITGRFWSTDSGTLDFELVVHVL